MFAVTRCETLGAPENGTFAFVGDVPQYLLYSIAEFSCQLNYEVPEEQDYILTCMPGGTWSSPTPTCVPIACDDEE